MAKACQHCGSVFPHLTFKDGCEWTTKPADLGWQCDCGSVKFILLKTGEIECARCAGKQPYKWAASA